MSDSFRRGRVQAFRSILGLLAVAACGYPRPASAEAATLGVEAEFQSRFTADSGLAPSGGTIAQAYESIDLSLPVAGSATNGLGVDLIAERLHFRFGDFGGFLPGRAPPLAAASLLTLQPTLVLTPIRDWSLITSALAQEAGADHASAKASTLWAGSLAAADQVTAALKLGFGMEVEQRMKASALLLPFPLIDWHISDRWSLTSLDGETGRLAYAFSGAWSAFGQLEFQSQDIRLPRTSSISSGIVRTESYPLSLGLQWKPLPHFTASLWGGEAVDQTYRFEDENGRLLRASAVHAPLIGTLDIDFSF